MDSPILVQYIVNVNGVNTPLLATIDEVHEDGSVTLNVLFAEGGSKAFKVENVTLQGEGGKFDYAAVLAVLDKPVAKAKKKA